MVLLDNVVEPAHEAFHFHLGQVGQHHADGPAVQPWLPIQIFWGGIGYKLAKHLGRSLEDMNS